MQAGLLHVDGQTDRHDEFKVALRNFAFERESYSWHLLSVSELMLSCSAVTDYS
jgi:hypothetical protein